MADSSSSGVVANTLTVFRRELAAYFESSIAAVFAGVFLVLSCGVFMNGFFLDGVLEMGAYFRILPLLLALFVPAVTMRTWAEERAQGTFELLMTLPLRAGEIVVGKYLAALVFYLATLSGSSIIVLMLKAFGDPDMAVIWASYVGAAALGAFFLALGVFLSAITKEQIVAFVVTVFFCAFFTLTGHEKVVEVLDGLSPAKEIGTRLAAYVSVMPHYDGFARGVVAVADLFYFGALSAFFLFLNGVVVRFAPR